MSVNRTVSVIDFTISSVNSGKFLPIDELLEGDKFRDMARERLRVDGLMAVARHPLKENRFATPSNTQPCSELYFKELIAFSAAQIYTYFLNILTTFT